MINRFVILLLSAIALLFVSSSHAQETSCTANPLLNVVTYPFVTVVSPDLIVVTGQENGALASYEIYIETSDVLTAKVSESGDTVAYTRFLPDRSMELWVTQVASPAPRLVARFDALPPMEEGARHRIPSIAQWEWLPGREILAYTASSDGSALVTQNDGNFAIAGSFAASPDGRYLSVTGVEALYLIDLDSDLDSDLELRSVSDSGTFQSIAAGTVFPQPHWLPDSSAFLRLLPAEDASTEIWRYPVEGQPEIIATIDVDTFSIRFAPTMTHLVFWRLNDRENPQNTIYVANIDGTDAREMVEGAFQEWLPDGDHFIYQVLTANGELHAYIRAICDEV